MGIRAIRLAVTGPNKSIADIDFSNHSNLVLGPSDTGKSYIVGCLKYALGSDKPPKQIKHASGYDRLSFQFATSDGQPYTIFRALAGGDSLFFKGCHDKPLSDREALSTHDVNDFVLNLLGLKNMQVVKAAGKKGNITAGDLRHFSLFTEGDTLSEAGYLGAEVVHKTRHNSAFYLMLTGIDDTAIVLGANKDDVLREKGKLMGLEEAINSLQLELPEDFDEVEVRALLEKIDNQISANQNLLREHSVELDNISSKMSLVGRELLQYGGQRTSALETVGRFRLLDNKYESDLERLELIRTAASVFDAFTPQPCALCNTPVLQQVKINDEQLLSAEQMAVSANAEYAKIEALRFGLIAAAEDVETELSSIEAIIKVMKEEQTKLSARHAEIVNQHKSPTSHELATLTKMHSEYVSQLKTYEKLQQFTARRKSIEPNTKKTKTKITRNASNEISIIVSRVQEILGDWGLEEAPQVSFDEATCDLFLLQSPRTSYGKGKRAIFLTAYSIAVMEHALRAESPHLGFVAIDSPVLTYRDPKHGKLGDENVIPVKVADKFFSWMADWRGPGQLVVLENEEPTLDLLSRIPHTLFIGPHGDGRRGFYP
jgi:t-SNARE complex subunit (syntaxin)